MVTDLYDVCMYQSDIILWKMTGGVVAVSFNVKINDVLVSVFIPTY
jgi:hypothetical protein